MFQPTLGFWSSLCYWLVTEIFLQKNETLGCAWQLWQSAVWEPFILFGLSQQVNLSIVENQISAGESSSVFQGWRYLLSSTLLLRTLEEAASVPVVYATAYYALVVRGGMKKGESVLIHSGSGGVGQAAIAIALSMGCRVFATVGKYWGIWCYGRGKCVPTCVYI